MSEDHAAEVAYWRAVADLHFPDRHGICIRCSYIMCFEYPRSEKSFPCGAWTYAAGIVHKLTGERVAALRL